MIGMQNIKVIKRKNKFTQDEDQVIEWFVQSFGTNFINIPKYLGNRTARQCRERWKNYLNPKVKQEGFSKEENILLIEKYFEFGGKWSEIAKLFEGRTDVKLKNQFDYLKRNGLVDFKLGEQFKRKEVDLILNNQFNSEIGSLSSGREDFNFFDFNDSNCNFLEEFFTTGKEFFQDLF
jgi:hypothetical protein